MENIGKITIVLEHNCINTTIIFKLNLKKYVVQCNANITNN